MTSYRVPQLTNEQLQTIYKRVLAGESVKAIAREVGKTDVWIGILLKREFGYRANVAPATKLTQEQKQELYERVAKGGEGVYQIAREYKVHPATIYKILRTEFHHVFDARTRWPQTLFLPADPLTIGYIAGLIDGEGSIICPKQTQNRWYVKIGMTDREVIDFLGSFGAKVNLQRKRDRGKRRKDAWHWNVHRRADVKHLLECVAPHLRVPAKREKARLALASLDYFG